MSGLLFTYRYPGPPSQGLLIKNRGNNAIIDAQMGMPQKFSPSAGDSMFSNNRKIYVKDSGGGTLLNGHYDSSQHIALKKLTAIGKSSTLKSTVSFQGQAQKQDSYRNSALARVRGGGTVAPKKKGALANPFKSGGGSSLTGTGNRQIIVYNDVLQSNKYYKSSEIIKHNTYDDAWVVFNNKVYNITSYPQVTHFDEAYIGTDITYSVLSRHTDISNTNKNAPLNKTVMETMLEPYLLIGNFQKSPLPTVQYTSSDVTEHNSTGNAWISWKNKVYNITTNTWTQDLLKKNPDSLGTDITNDRDTALQLYNNGIITEHVPNNKSFEYLLEFYQVGVLID